MHALSTVSHYWLSGYSDMTTRNWRNLRRILVNYEVILRLQVYTNNNDVVGENGYSESNMLRLSRRLEALPPCLLVSCLVIEIISLFAVALSLRPPYHTGDGLT